MASETKKPNSPNPNLKCSHVSTEVHELSLLTANWQCIDNYELVNNFGHDSGIEHRGDDENIGLHMDLEVELGGDYKNLDLRGVDMSEADAQVHHEELPLEEGAVESDDEKVLPSVGKKK
uniref:Uncharacterized protein n=1 Tax=Cucumis sativus TaxID=3659 RepID=A0A0A0K393_CUCSA